MNLTANFRPRLMKLLIVVSIGVLASACQEVSQPVAKSTPVVKAFEVEQTAAKQMILSGIVKAKYELPLAFQVPGRIENRHISAGQDVEHGALLFNLDPNDLRQQLDAAKAQYASAKSALDIAEADLNRVAMLYKRKLVSAYDKERTELVMAEAQARLKVAQSQVSKAQNAVQYGQLTAPQAGTIIRLYAEQGQVVNVGQPIADFAAKGERDVEVFLPEHLTPPAIAHLQLSTEQLEVQLREFDGMVQPQGRVLRARYQIAKDIDQLKLGALVKVAFELPNQDGTHLTVPIGALSERGTQSQVWRIVDNKVFPVPVKIEFISAEYAEVSGALERGDIIVATGTHLLQQGMVVKVKR